ncbi:MAG: UDP-N-acetylglucosamine 2-epimerase (non-hydrolyzing) [Deltaproteobacteria bacterium]|jgi:UDP-N-acetylglucosamine 2-epimerase
MRVVSVVGTRSDLVKCAPIARALGEDHTLVHTGLPFDYGTDDGFFADLELPPPAYDLGVTGGTNAQNLQAILAGLLERLTDPVAWLLVYGGSAATIAGAIVGAKRSIPVAHIGAGLRSYRRRTPDEVNHIVVDHLSRLHFCPTPRAVEALAREGLTEGVHQVGDVLLDNVVRGLEIGKRAPLASLADRIGVDPAQPFAVATIHHHENLEDESRLAALIRAFSALPWPVVLPLHPRTQESLTERWDVASQIGANISIVDPLRPIETLLAVSRAWVVLTDSGGLQRESFFLGVPCVTLRDDSEWVDTIDVAHNVVAGADPEAIERAARSAARAPDPKRTVPLDTPFGDGTAGRRIVDILRRGVG